VIRRLALASVVLRRAFALLSLAGRRRPALAALILIAGTSSSVLAQEVALGASHLRADWVIERTARGQARVVGYLYNRNIQDAANVWLRVERLGADGAVAGVSRGRVVGDVISGDRLAFYVPVPDAAATYRVVVESVDWVKECR
jgi:hypothetical protein